LLQQMSKPHARAFRCSTIRAAFAIAMTTSACAPDDEFEGVLAEEDEEAFRVHFDAMSNNFEYVQDDGVGARATAYLELPIKNANGTPAATVGGFAVRGTCGVTFIAPHYAITAAHCVASPHVADNQQQITVNHLDISDIDYWSLAFSSTFDGNFPNFEPLTETAQDLPGYQKTSMQCTVSARCGSSNTINCAINADVAMLYCPTRASTAPWIPIAASDPWNGTGAVEMYWYHEVLFIDSNLGDVAYPEDLDRWTHYTMYNPSVPNAVDSKRNNFHYLASPMNSILPLHSVPWSGGTQRRRINAGSTDLFGCHGSSGSGIFQRNAQNNLELLGPAATGPGWADTRLCRDPEEYAPGVSRLTYTSNDSVRQLQTAYHWALFFDRNPIVWQPWNPGGPVLDPTG
jgi:hypothetical protein